jgi:hypothetical protein
MQLRCSRIMSHEVSQVLAIRLAVQRRLELIHSLRGLERESMIVGHIPADGNAFRA